ncbi:MAG: methylenetetrahydrofolate reductase [Nitrospiria bacterium]
MKTDLKNGPQLKTLKEACEAGDFIITAEAAPPKGSDIGPFCERAEKLLGRVHALNVTDNQAAIMRASSLAMSKILLDMGHDPVFQVTGRDRNRLAIQSDLLGAQILGIRNVLSLTGDYVTVGNQRETKPVFDLESVQILNVLADLNVGRDMVGNALKGPTNLFPGAVAIPESDSFDALLIKFQKKVMAGAKFFQTQAVFNPDQFKRFMDFARRFDVKIIAGILLLRSEKMATYVTRHIPGIRVPDPLIQKLAQAGKEGGLEAGLDIAVSTIEAVRGMCDGVHIMAIGAEKQVPVILDRADLRPVGADAPRPVEGVA